MSLYQLANSYVALLEKDEYTAEDLMALQALDDDVKSKAINVASFIKNLEGVLMAVEATRKSMQERERKIKKKIEDLTGYLKFSLQSCNISAITDSDRFEIRLKKNPQKVDIYNADALPKEYWVIPPPEPRPDKVRIGELLKSDRVVPGARLIQETRVEIK